MFEGMVTVGWILFGFGIARLGVAFFNMATRPYLPCRRPETGDKTVSVLVPARNEEANIERLLENFTTWRDEVLELVIYDDMSSDGTYALAMRKSVSDPKIKVMEGRGLPAGWLGKNHACHRLATRASGDMLLFIDADVTLDKDTVTGAVNYMEDHGSELLSLFPTQIIDNPGSRLSVPLMNWILLSLLPLMAVRLSGRPSLAAANGQFMMFCREGYLNLLPHSVFRKSPVEDIAIIKYYKRQGMNAAVLLGHDDVNCRMYNNLKEAIGGFSRNIFDFFGGNAFLCFLFVIATTLAPFWIFIFNGHAAGVVYVSVVIFIRICVSVTSRQNGWLNVILIIPQHIVLWIITIRATISRKNKKLIWKGRNIS